MSKRVTECECVGLDDFGRGICHIDNTTVFVEDFLPGERGQVATIFKYGKLESAKLVKLITKSPERVKSPCPYYPACGGCQIAHLNYDAQLEYKRKKVQDLLHKFANIDIEVEKTIGLDSPKRFRNKVQKPVRYLEKKKATCAGFYARNTHDLIPIKDCLMESELSNSISNYLLTLIKKYHYTAYNEDRETGQIRHFLIKTSSDQKQALVTLIVNDPDLKGIKYFAKDLVEKFKEVQGLILNVNRRKTNVILGEKDIHVYGKRRIADKIFSNTFLISTHSFYQTNARQIETLYKTAIDFADLKKSDRLLDAYCGTGTIGLTASAYVKEVTGVELVKDSVKDANVNAKINGINNARFINADCTDYMLQTKDKFDVIILDPPRKGSTPEFISAAIKMNPERIVYVSCDPVTLARDLKLFKEYYDVKRVQPVDMFPNSMHVENVCLLTLRK